MAWMANDSAINVTPEIQKALENASIEEMKDILHSAAVDQKLAVPDAIDSSILHETGLAMNAPKKFTRSITVAADGGNKKTYTLEANSPEELQATEVQFWRELTAPPQGQEQQRDSAGRFVAEDPVIAEQVETWLRRRGLDPEYLQEAAGKGYLRSWEAATEVFKQRHPEYQGSEENVQRFGEAIIRLGLDDSPSVESLEAAYEELQRTGGLVESPDVAYAERLATATDSAEIARICAQHFGTSGQLWNRI
jgi:hypothetical protein